MEEDILARGQDPADFPILNSKPEMFPDLVWIYEGFMCLSASRQFGMGAPQRISITDVLSYCEYRGIDDDDDRDDFLFHVQQLDQVFMVVWRKNNPVKTDKSSAPMGMGQS